MLARSWSGLSESSDDVCEGAGILQTLRRADQEHWVEGERLHRVREEGEDKKEKGQESSKLKILTRQKRNRGEDWEEEDQVVVEKVEEKEEEKIGAFAPPYKVLRHSPYGYPSYPLSSSSSTSSKIEEEDEEDGREEEREDEPASKVLEYVTSPRDHQMMDMLAAVVQQQQQQQQV